MATNDRIILDCELVSSQDCGSLVSWFGATALPAAQARTAAGFMLRLGQKAALCGCKSEPEDEEQKAMRRGLCRGRGT